MGLPGTQDTAASSREEEPPTNGSLKDEQSSLTPTASSSAATTTRSQPGEVIDQDGQGKLPSPSQASVGSPVVASFPAKSSSSWQRVRRTPSAAEAPPPAAPSASSNPVVVERENFLVFIKILFKILEEAHEPQTKARAQRIVVECRRRSRSGDPNYNPMMDVLEKHLRGFVGETKWRKAHLFLHHYIHKRGGPGGGMAMRRPTALAL